MTAAAMTTSAEHKGRMWGARPRDWADSEALQEPTYHEAIRRAAVRAGDRVLDLGCGAGTFLRLAAAHGALPTGLDASEALVAIARERVRAAEVRVGDMQQLPFEDGAFDLVTAFNSLFFADDMVVALREAGRVTRPGGTVLVQVWGRPERCELSAMKDALRPFLDAGGAPPAALYEPGALEELARAAGLVPADAFDFSYAWEFPDARTLARLNLSVPLATLAARTAGDEAVAQAIVGALAPYRRPDGSYSIANEWHYLVARKPQNP